MKKIGLLICIILVILFKHQCTAQSHSSTALMITLNGYSLDDADNMVNAHIADHGSYTKSTRTNVWFSKAYVNSIDSLLHAEIAEDNASGKTDIPDGIRIYYARDANGFNIILVSTRSQGITDDANGSSIHQDYFRHGGLFFKSPAIKGLVDHGSPGSGAQSYSDLYKNFTCPGTDNCTITGDVNHYINCSTAINWINNYDTNPSNKIEGDSEWFDLDLIDNLNQELQNETNGADGLRIYFAKKITDNAHCFILVTTKNGMNDYYECLPQMKTQFLQSKLLKQSKIIKKLKLSPQNLKGGDDNGEQCPDNCTGVTWP